MPGHMNVGKHDVGRTSSIFAIAASPSPKVHDVDPLIGKGEVDDLLDRHRIVCQQKLAF